MTTSAEKVQCNSCDIKCAPEDRWPILAELVRNIIHQQWAGNPTLTLNDVANYFRFTDRPDVSDQEWDLVDGCLAEHSAERCQQLNP